MTDHPPAGWYPNPDGTPDSLRFWDGASWTARTRSAGRAAVIPEPVVAPTPEPPAETGAEAAERIWAAFEAAQPKVSPGGPPTGRSNVVAAMLILLVLLVAVGAIALVALHR